MYISNQLNLSLLSYNRLYMFCQQTEFAKFRVAKSQLMNTAKPEQCSVLTTVAVNLYVKSIGASVLTSMAQRQVGPFMWLYAWIVSKKLSMKITNKTPKDGVS